MAQRLTNNNKGNYNGSQLTTRNQIPFKISIEHSLENGFCFKDLKQSNIKEFHTFIEETVGKNLSITQVEKLYKRTRGPKDTIRINGTDYELVHLGKDRKAFRVFGYFNRDMFVLSKIDPKHKTHKC